METFLQLQDRARCENIQIFATTYQTEKTQNRAITLVLWRRYQRIIWIRGLNSIEGVPSQTGLVCHGNKSKRKRYVQEDFYITLSVWSCVPTTLTYLSCSDLHSLLWVVSTRGNVLSLVIITFQLVKCLAVLTVGWYLTSVSAKYTDTEWLVLPSGWQSL